MNGWILYCGKPVTEITRMQETTKEAGFDIKIIDPANIEVFLDDDKSSSFFVDGVEMPAPEFVLAAFANDPNYHNIAVLKQLESQGVLCVNGADTLMNTKDKLRTLQLLAAEGIPVPKTLLVKFPADVDFIEKQFGFPLVLKVIGGSKGDGVVLVKSRDHLDDMLQMFEAGDLAEDVIIQEFIETSKGRDLRVFIADRKAVAGMLRSNVKEDGFKSNYSAGGSVYEYELTPEIIEIAEKVVDVIGLNIGGIDLLFTENGFTVCEANSMPGYEGLEKACSVNIPAEILKGIARQLAERKPVS